MSVYTAPTAHHRRDHYQQAGEELAAHPMQAYACRCIDESELQRANSKQLLCIIQTLKLAGKFVYASVMTPCMRARGIISRQRLVILVAWNGLSTCMHVL